MTQEIKPVSIWYNGQQETATNFSLVSVYDDFVSTATLYYQLLSSDNLQLTQGNQTIDGTEYQSWNNDPNANEWIINWSASKLGLILV